LNQNDCKYRIATDYTDFRRFASQILLLSATKTTFGCFQSVNIAKRLTACPEFISGNAFKNMRFMSKICAICGRKNLKTIITNSKLLVWCNLASLCLCGKKVSLVQLSVFVPLWQKG